MLKKMAAWVKDHYHLLFKSAADNHLRIQNLLKNSDGSYQLTVNFGSYTELKNYQKKVRRLTVSLSSAIAMVIVAFIISPYILHPNKSAASNFTWTQGKWGGGVDTAAQVTSATQSTFNKYNSSSNVTATDSGVTLPLPAPSSTGDSTYASAPSGFYLSGGALVLSKLDGLSCTSASQCKSNFCSTNNLCGVCEGVSSISYNGDTYAIVPIGNQCWFKENLRTSKNPAGTALTLGADYYCYTGDTNCASSSAVADANGSKYGALYTWHAAMNVAGSYDATTLNVGVNYQGICPNGWHIPSDAEQYTLENYLKDSGQTCDALRNGPYDCVSAGTKLKSGGSSGFNFALAGIYNGSYANRDSYTLFWSTSESSSTRVWGRVMYSGSGISRSSYSKVNGSPVRCVKN